MEARFHIPTAKRIVNQSMFRAYCWITLAFAVLGNAHSASADEPSPAEKAIRQTAQTFTDAYNQGDAKAVAALWTADGTYSLGSNTVEGRENIQKLYDAFLKAHPGSKMEVQVKSVRMLAPTVAMEQGTASVRGSANGPPTASEYTAIHVKQGDGQWLMADVHESELPTIVPRDLNELAWLIGDWEADGDAAKIEISYEWMADKNFIRVETKVHHQDKSETVMGGTQIIGRNPTNGQIVSWFFHADGGHGYGAWVKDGSRWLTRSRGATAQGRPTSATNILYQADDNVMSWQSVDRTVGNQRVSDTKEIVIERAAASATATQ